MLERVNFPNRIDQRVGVYLCVVALDREANKEMVLVRCHGDLNAIALEQGFLQEVRIHGRHRDHHHLTKICIVTNGTEPGHGAAALEGLRSKGMTRPADVVPGIPSLEFDSSWHAQEGGQIARALPLQTA